MVYIYKKILGKKPYYYLRASERKGKKVTVKDIAYLGNSIKEVKKALVKLPFKEKIRKAHRNLHNFIESNYYLEKASTLKLKKEVFLGEKLEEVEACKMHYNKVFQKNNELTKEDILKNFVVEFAFNTTSIEGNTITLKEARNLLEESITPKNKTLREIYDLQNTEKVFFELLKSDKKINQELIVKIHSDLIENIDNRKGYRTRDVRVFNAKFKATPFPYIKTDMRLLLKWYKQNRKKLHPLVLASIFHHKFEKIHPFFDGNGRVGRMLLNFILLKSDYPPLVIHKKSWREFFDVLEEADKSNLTKAEKKHYINLVKFIAEEMIESYWDIFL